MKCVELGGERHPEHPDWEQFDALDWSDYTGLTYTLGDASHLPYMTESIDHIYSRNLLEHFPEYQTVPIIKEWTRVLRVGGTLEMIVPDSIGILNDYFEGTDSWEHCTERLLGTRDYKGNTHHRAFTFYDFIDLIETIPVLELGVAESSHNGGGIHTICRKVE